MKKIKLFILCILILSLFSSTAYMQDEAATFTLSNIASDNNLDLSKVSRVSVSSAYIDGQIQYIDQDIPKVLRLIEEIQFEPMRASIYHAGAASGQVEIRFDDIKSTKINILDNGSCYIWTYAPTPISSMPPTVAVTTDTEKIKLLIESLMLNYPDVNERNECVLTDSGFEINGKLSKLARPALNLNGHIYVPVREFCEKLDLSVNWNDSENKVIIGPDNEKKISTSDKTELKEGVIPDEETALAVGKIILEANVGKKLEYETEDKVFYLTAYYFEDDDIWCVKQTFKYKDETQGWQSRDDVYIPSIELSGSTGEVLYINTYSSLDE